MRLHASLSLAVCALAVACSKDQPELEPVHKSASAPTAAATTTAASADPMHGSFTLAQATEGIEGKGPLVATIATSKGTLECKLFDDRAPVTVANFIGLATGKRTWKEPGSGKWVNRPAYDGTTFHRVIKGFMIQGGDPAGDGSGEPGYVIKDELWDGAKHDKAGQLCMANRGPDTNGAQFFITDAPAPHLDKPNPRTGKRTAYTIFGQCAPLDVVHDIAAVKTVPPNRPESAVTIEKVTISRGK